MCKCLPLMFLFISLKENLELQDAERNYRCLWDFLPNEKELVAGKSTISLKVFFDFFCSFRCGVFVGDSHLILSVVFLNVGLVWWFSLRFNRSPVAFSLNVTLALYSRMSACQSILCTVYLTCSLWLSSGLLMLILNVVWSPSTVDTLLTSYVAALARLVNLRCLFVWVGMNRMLRVSCLRSKFKRKKKVMQPLRKWMKRVCFNAVLSEITVHLAAEAFITSHSFWLGISFSLFHWILLSWIVVKIFSPSMYHSDWKRCILWFSYQCKYHL